MLQAKRAFLLVFLFGGFIPLRLAAQISISGQVQDADAQAPVEFATVTLLSASDSSLIRGSLTDASGRFLLEIAERGNMLLQFTFVGYEGVELPLRIGENNDIYSVGKIMLAQKARQLDEVVVSGERSVVSSDLDSRTYSMDDQFAQGGSSVLDAMKGLPGINVDQDGKVELRGSDKVAILIDGKQSSLTGFGNQKGLSNIPAANIERIEIITNPSAKYDASGMAGIINIIYKKEKEIGFNGEVGFKYGLGQLSKRKDDLPTDLGSFSKNPKYIPSLLLNYRKDKVNFFLQSEVMWQERLPNNEFNSRY